MAFTGRLKLWLLAFGGGTPEVPINETIYQLEGAVNASVVDRTHTAPPGGAVAGDCYLVAASATGSWEGKDGQIAVCIGASAWKFVQPTPGMVVWLQSEKVILRYLTANFKSIIGVPTIERYNSANVSIGSSMAVVTHDTDIVNDTGFYALDADNGGIQLVEIGRHLVEADLTVVSSGTAAENTIDAKLTLDGSDLAGSKASCRVGPSNALRSQLHISRVVETVSANQVVRVLAQRAAGSSTINALAEGFRMRVTKL